MKNAKNIRYTLINLKGFIMDPDTGSMAIFPTAQAAMKLMKPGDQIIPIKSDQERADYESGRLRAPSVNRHGRR
jgi:hypothetical protein